jgi:hypothetical protein
MAGGFSLTGRGSSQRQLSKIMSLSSVQQVFVLGFGVVERGGGDRKGFINLRAHVTLFSHKKSTQRGFIQRGEITPLTPH